MKFIRHRPTEITGHFTSRRTHRKPWNGKIKKLTRGYFWWPGLNKQTS